LENCRFDRHDLPIDLFEALSIVAFQQRKRQSFSAVLVTAHKSGGPKPKLAAYDEALRTQVAQKADVILVELQAWLATDHAVKVSIGALWARVRHLGLTLQKSRNAPQSRIVQT
jgi:transposase